jgi:hypothetical protein
VTAIEIGGYRRGRQRCHVCDRFIGVDFAGNLVTHGLGRRCEGSGTEPRRRSGPWYRKAKP